MCSLLVTILIAVLLQVKTFVLYPHYFDQKVPLIEVQMFVKALTTLQICLYWAAVLIPTLVVLKDLMPVSSMWPIGPLVKHKIHQEAA